MCIRDRLINDEVIKAIQKNAELAPLHNPPNLLGIEATSESLPNVPQVAVFDTAIHQTMPPKAYLYGLPKEFYTKYSIRRYGFHGTSHGYVAKKAAKFINKPFEKLKIITCHLGNGCSITAFLNGKSVDTSMGFTPLEGILMGTRCGDLDPYIPLYIMEIKDMPIEEVNILMNKKAGLLALTGKRDMRDILDEAKKGSVDAINGIEMFVYRIQKYIGAYTAAMDGVDIIVFTAGIGENSSYIRKKILQNFSYLGLEVDNDANEKNQTIISTPNSKVYAMAIHTNEELVIALETFEIISEIFNNFSNDINSTCGTSIIVGVTYGSYATTLRPNGNALLATFLPILPNPISPKIFPFNSYPIRSLLLKSPFLVLEMARFIFLQVERINPKVRSATLSKLSSGAVTTRTPGFSAVVIYPDISIPATPSPGLTPKEG